MTSRRELLKSAGTVTAFGFGLTRVEQVAGGNQFKTKQSPFIEFSLNVVDELPDHSMLHGGVSYQPYNLVRGKKSGDYAVYVSEWSQTNLMEVEEGPVIASPSAFLRGSSHTLTGVPYRSTTLGSVSFIRNTEPETVKFETSSNSAKILLMGKEFKIMSNTGQKHTFDYEIPTASGESTQNVKIDIEIRYLPNVRTVGHESGLLLPKNSQTARIAERVRDDSESISQSVGSQKAEEMSVSEYPDHSAYVINRGNIA